MEIDITKKQYNHTTYEDKHYFGGFLNLAQNNIDEVFKAFRYDFPKKENNKKTKNIQIIDSYFTDNLAISEFERRVDFLKQHFPVIQYLYLPTTDKLFEEVRDTDKIAKRNQYFKDNLKNLLIVIDKLRSFYTHYYHNKLHIDNVEKLYDDLFLKTVMDVQKSKTKNDQTRQLLKQTLLRELEILKIQKIEKFKQEGKEQYKDSAENAVINDAFKHLTYNNKPSKYYYTFKLEKETENGINISQNALIFLISMFLTRKQNEDLKSKIIGFKAKVFDYQTTFPDVKNNSLKNMATHWVFNHLSYRGLKQRLNTSFSKETLLIQIIDELNKIPNELYNTFNDDLKQEFIVDINEYIKESKEDISLDESIIIHPVIRKRYENKFAYFAIRYLDEFANFPTLRFQVHLGNYIRDIREKEISGTKYTTERTIKEKIKVFGKLSAVSLHKEKYFQNQQEDDTLGWEIFPNPSYSFIGNNIPISLKLPKDVENEIKELKKELKVNEKKSYKKRILVNPLIDRSSNERVEVGDPTALLSINELPSLLYELLVNKKKGDEIEEQMKNKLIERINTIKNYTNDDILPTSKITKNLRKSKQEKTININKLINAINTEISISDDKLKQLEINRKNDERKYTFTHKEMGQEASFLADDLIRFMPKENRKNWRSHHHNQLQQSIAYYELNPQEAFNIIKEFWNLDNNTYVWNKGIKQAFAEKQFEDFFNTYHQNRKKELISLKNRIKEWKDNSKLLRTIIRQNNVWNIFHKRLYIIDTMDNQKKKLLTKPLVFTRGIFDEKPTYIKNTNVDKNPELYADWYTYFLKHQKFQKFYDYTRDYEYLEEWISENTELENKYNLSNEQKFKLFKHKHDKKIKKIQLQDLYLSLIAKDLYFKTFDTEAQFNLNELYVNKNSKIEPTNEASNNIINADFIWSKTAKFHEGQLKEDAVKLKDFGKFKRFLEDEKVKHLFSYNENKNWTKQEIEDELLNNADSYEVLRRDVILKEIQLLEKSILHDWNFNGKDHPKELEQNSNPNFKMYIANGLLKKHNLTSPEEIQWLIDLNQETIDNITTDDLKKKSEITQKAYLLILIRNKTAHNQLLKKEHYTLIAKKENNTSSHSKIICNFALDCINFLKPKKT